MLFILAKKYKKIIDIISNNILEFVLEKVKKARLFLIPTYETSNVENIEPLSIAVCGDW